MSLLRPSRGLRGPRRAPPPQRSDDAVLKSATAPSLLPFSRPQRSLLGTSSPSIVAAAAATTTPPPPPPPPAAPPADFDLRAALVPQTRALVSLRWPELLDLVDDGSLVALPRAANYVERRTDGYEEPELVLLVAAAHVSRASASAARRVVEAVRPEAVVLELCGSRKAVLVAEEGEEEEEDGEGGEGEASSSSSSSPLSAGKRRKASNPFALSGSLARSASLGGAPAMALRLLLARQSDAVLEAALENERSGSGGEGSGGGDDEAPSSSSSSSPLSASAFSRHPGVEARAAAAGEFLWLALRFLAVVIVFFGQGKENEAKKKRTPNSLFSQPPQNKMKK